MFVILVSVTWAVRDKSLKVEILIFLRRSHLLRLVVPELLLGLALDLRHDELDVLGNQLAFLPGHWLAGVGARPHLGKARF